MKTRPLPAPSGAVLIHRRHLARVRSRAALTTMLVVLAAGAELGWRWNALEPGAWKWAWGAAGALSLLIAARVSWGLAMVGWARVERRRQDASKQG